MNQYEEIMILAQQAAQIEAHAADAAALLIDAAALCIVETNFPISEFVGRLERSYATTQAAREAVATYGDAATWKQ